MIIALAQTNPLVGDIEGNAKKIADHIDRARRAGAELVVFPELTITGYPPRDLLLKPSFVEENVRALRHLANCTANGPAALVGFVAANSDPVGRPLRNAMGLLQKGKPAGEFYKALLPTNDVYDELRYFEPAHNSSLARIDFDSGPIDVGVTICEDLWNDERLVPRRLYHRNPIDDLVAAGAKLIVNSSASPFALGKQAFREQLMSSHAAAKSVPLVSVNQVGGNDELLFDGASIAFDTHGNLIARAKPFQEDLLIVDFSAPQAARTEPYPQDVEAVWRGLVMGTKDYVGKCGFYDVTLGLSGGIDSAVTAAIAVEALSADRVHPVAMPSRYSSDHSLADAKALAENLAMDLAVIPIRTIHETVENELIPHFDGRSPDVTEENLQARIRGTLLMALSNKFGRLLLATGNKSELAVGYCTLYGDMCGGLAVLTDVSKTMVYDLARWANDRAGREVIPQSIIAKIPSAELKPDQSDQDTLPPYDVLDPILQEYVENQKSAAEIIDRGFDADTVRDIIRRVDQNEHKRKQAPVGLKVTDRAFGVGRRMPIAAKFS